jgi:phospholipase/lecithinase/hemolysin
VKSLIKFAAGILLFGLAVCPTQAGFTSLYIFGDGVSTTTTNASAGQYYYGLRNSNGRVWVELLAQQQGLTNNYWYSNNSSIHLSYTNLSASSTNWSYSSNNWSYYGQFSSNLVVNLTNFPPPLNANTALFVVWVNDADFVGDVQSFGQPNNSDHGTNITSWTNAINLSLTNHWKAITNLYYAKGARTLILPNAVDITEVPEYNASPPAYKSFVRQRVIDFNTAFTILLNQARTSLPGVTIYEPDVFTLLDNVLTNAAAYGLTNVLSGGYVTDVIENDSLTNKSLNGPGTNYIFWDSSDPTAKFHAVLADVVQHLISPAQITNLTLLDDDNRLDVASLPIGLNGFVDGCTNLVLANWAPQASFNSTDATQAIFAPASDSQQLFYRLRFPYAWSWP